jgi:hypothetical protein
MKERRNGKKTCRADHKYIRSRADDDDDYGIGPVLCCVCQSNEITAPILSVDVVKGTKRLR